jgi:hypothetical protein
MKTSSFILNMREMLNTKVSDVGYLLIVDAGRQQKRGESAGNGPTP